MKTMLFAYSKAFIPTIIDEELSKMYQEVMQTEGSISKGIAEMDFIDFTYCPENIAHENAKTVDIHVTSINISGTDEIEIYE